MRVTLYTRQSSSRKFKRITEKQMFAGGNFPARDDLRPALHEGQQAHI